MPSPVPPLTLNMDGSSSQADPHLLNSGGSDDGSEPNGYYNSHSPKKKKSSGSVRAKRKKTLTAVKNTLCTSEILSPGRGKAEQNEPLSSSSTDPSSEPKRGSGGEKFSYTVSQQTLERNQVNELKQVLISHSHTMDEIATMERGNSVNIPLITPRSLASRRPTESAAASSGGSQPPITPRSANSSGKVAPAPPERPKRLDNFGLGGSGDMKSTSLPQAPAPRSRASTLIPPTPPTYQVPILNDDMSISTSQELTRSQSATNQLLSLPLPSTNTNPVPSTPRSGHSSLPFDMLSPRTASLSKKNLKLLDVVVGRLFVRGLFFSLFLFFLFAIPLFLCRLFFSSILSFPFSFPFYPLSLLPITILPIPYPPLPPASIPPSLICILLIAYLHPIFLISLLNVLFAMISVGSKKIIV